MDPPPVNRWHISTAGIFSAGLSLRAGPRKGRVVGVLEMAGSMQGWPGWVIPARPASPQARSQARDFPAVLPTPSHSPPLEREGRLGKELRAQQKAEGRCLAHHVP